MRWRSTWWCSGFYPAGSAEISDAVQAAVKQQSPGRVLVPISNWAAFGGSKEVMIWMPIDMIANTITAVIAVRKQMIEDIYQVMGLSDIMRGATDPDETLGAQQLKSQYGSVRIRDKQGEMVRVARDIEEITAEIMCSEFCVGHAVADVADGNSNHGRAAAEADDDGAAAAGDAGSRLSSRCSRRRRRRRRRAWRRRRTRR